VRFIACRKCCFIYYQASRRKILYTIVFPCRRARARLSESSFVLSRVYERSSIGLQTASGQSELSVPAESPNVIETRERSSIPFFLDRLDRLDRLIWNDSSSIRRMNDDVRTRSLSFPTCVVSLLFFSPFSSETERHRVKVPGLTVRSFVRYRVSSSRYVK